MEDSNPPMRGLFYNCVGLKKMDLYMTQIREKLTKNPHFGHKTKIIHNIDFFKHV